MTDDKERNADTQAQETTETATQEGVQEAGQESPVQPEPSRLKKAGQLTWKWGKRLAITGALGGAAYLGVVAYSDYMAEQHAALMALPQVDANQDLTIPLGEYFCKRAAIRGGSDKTKARAVIERRTDMHAIMLGGQKVRIDCSKYKPVAP